MPEVKVGQVWYDKDGGGFAEVRALDSIGMGRSGPQRLATMSGPAEFWNDCRTMKSIHRVAVALMEPAHGWHGPYAEPVQCPMAQYFPSLGTWGRKGMVL